MKKKLMTILLLVFISTFFFSGFFWKKDPQEEINKKLEQAEEALSRKNYEGALVLFEQAGEAGKEGIIKTYAAKLYRNYSSDAFSKEYIERIHKEIDKSQIEKKEIYILIWKTVQEEASKTTEYFYTDENGRFNNYLPYPELNDLKKTISNLESQGFKSPKEVNNELYNIEAKILLNWGNEKLIQGNCNKALEFWSKCTEGSEGYKITQAIKDIKLGNIEKSYEILNDLIYDKEFIWKIIEENEPNSRYTTTEQLWKYISSKRNIAKIIGKLEVKSLSTSLSEAELTRFSIANYHGNPILTEAERVTLPQIIGTNPKGKILILNRRTVFETKEKQLDMYLKIMKDLPEEYYPSNYEEVEYIILVDSTYSNAGTYNSGAKRLRESAKMTVYHVPSEKILYTKKVQGELPEAVIYTSRIGKYESISVDMKEPLIEASKKITKHKYNS